jgi:hypothetical protein
MSQQQQSTSTIQRNMFNKKEPSFCLEFTDSYKSDNEYTFLPTYGSGIRIACLPDEYNTHISVVELMERVLCIGCVYSVRIEDIILDNQKQTKFKTAYIKFKYWYESVNNIMLNTYLDNLVEYRKNYPETITKNVELYSQYQFHWANGSPMDHLSIRPIFLKEKKTTESWNLWNLDRKGQFQEMTLSEDKWKSLYIPIIPNDLWLDGRPFDPRNDLQKFIEHYLCIGKVRRIDFVDRDDLDVFDGNKPVIAAFIHMDKWYDNKIAHDLRNTLDNVGNFRQKGYLYCNQENHIQLSKFYTFVDHDLEMATNPSKIQEKYFVFKINYKPIPDADGLLNIHQLSAIKTKNEEEIVKNAEEIEGLKKLLKEKDTEMERLRGIIIEQYKSKEEKETNTEY